MKPAVEGHENRNKNAISGLRRSLARVGGEIYVLAEVDDRAPHCSELYAVRYEFRERGNSPLSITNLLQLNAFAVLHFSYFRLLDNILKNEMHLAILPRIHMYLCLYLSSKLKSYEIQSMQNSKHTYCIGSACECEPKIV